jgi:integration host factor subunit beta
MTRVELVAQIARENNLTPAHARVVVDVIFDTISTALADGRRVELRNFGIFYAKTYPPRDRRNPQTGEILMETTTTRVQFKTGRRIHQALNAMDAREGSQR